MECPKCKKQSSSIRNSRKKISRVKRERICDSCLHQFTTYEITSKRLEALEALEKSMLKLNESERELNKWKESLKGSRAGTGA